MGIDLTQITPWQIAGVTAIAAVVGTVIAAGINAFSAYTVAQVNANAARELSRLTARREYHKDTFDRFFRRIDRDIGRWTRIPQALTRLAAGHDHLVDIAERVNEEHKDIERIQEDFKRFFTYRPDHSDVDPAVRSFFEQDGTLRKAYDALVDVSRNSEATLHSVFEAVKSTAKPYELQRARDDAALAIRKIVILRMAAEEFIYRP
jgi:hypothetical protein